MSEVRLENVTYRYGEVVAADQVDLTVGEGEFFALLGPSGSGKTTILRLIAGFLQPQEGDIRLGGQSITRTPSYARNIGFVFQNYALFPHMTVAQNVAFGLESRRVAKPELHRRVQEVLAMVELEGLGERRPRALSGGQQQRVALARAIVTQPGVLLLDEPLGALDKKLRTQMQVELRDLQQRLGITTLFVTHDQEEALTLSDRIAVMRAGRIMQQGPPRDVYERPRSHFVCDFLGEANIMPATVSAISTDGFSADLAGGLQIRGRAHPGMQEGDSILCAVRPERVRLFAHTPDEGAFALQGQVQHVAYMGASINLHVALPNGQVMVVFAQSGGVATEVAIGQTVWLTWARDYTLLLDEAPESTPGP